MAEETDSGEYAEHEARFETHRSSFYAMIGHYVTLYQSVEDYLADLFVAALPVPEEQSAAIFAVVRGLEAKLNIISATLITADDAHKERWQVLVKRVAAAAEARNQIAHASPVHHGPTVNVILGSPDKAPTIRLDHSTQRMELHKQTRSGEHVWTLERMREEHRRTDKLYGHLIALAKQLKGETPPEHLLEE
jgi:hypothetical protein